MSKPKRHPGDRNFDDLVHRFSDRITKHLKGELRLQLIRSELEDWCPKNSTPMVLLDAGGGFGSLSREYAQGHQVHLTFQPRCSNMAKNNTVSRKTSPIITVQSSHLTSTLSTLFFVMRSWRLKTNRFIEHLARLLKPQGRCPFCFTTGTPCDLNGSCMEKLSVYSHHLKRDMEKA